jgi:hypothetical protein
MYFSRMAPETVFPQKSRSTAAAGDAVRKGAARQAVANRASFRRVFTSER